MATKERLAAMSASLRAVCSGPMVPTLVRADPSDPTSELRTYVCAECGHTLIERGLRRPTFLIVDGATPACE